MRAMAGFESQITFLYYREMAPIARFFEETLGLELVEDQVWAKIYRVAGSAFLGVVAGEKGFHAPRPENAVLVTLVVNDVPRWYERLLDSGVEMLSEVQHKTDIQIRGFFFKDPGGYTFEVQQFLKSELAAIFHGKA